MMNFEKSDIQTMLLDSAERLLSKDAGVGYWRAQKAAPDGFSPERWSQFAQLGWLALGIPKGAGGLGGTLEDVALLNVELGRALATEPYVSSAVLAAHLLSGAAGESFVALLGEIGSGRLKLALAFQELGRDPAASVAADTIAIGQDDGFALSGTKLMALDAPSADKLVVSATIAGQDGVALFLVDRDAAGLALDSYPLIDGTRAADVRLSDVKVPADALVASGEAAATLLAEAIDRASVALLAQAVGSMEACLSVCGNYVKERHQFGVAIGTFQAIQHILSDMFVAAHQARSMLYHALANGGEPELARRAALSAAKIVIAEAGMLVARNGIQVHGGYGVTDEFAISHHYRRLMCIEKLYGDSERHIGRFAEQALAG